MAARQGWSLVSEAPLRGSGRFVDWRSRSFWKGLGLSHRLFWEVVLSSPRRLSPVRSDDYEDAVEAHARVVSRGAGMADALRADAMSTAHACRVLGISAASSRRWHQRYGLM